MSTYASAAKVTRTGWVVDRRTGREYGHVAHLETVEEVHTWQGGIEYATCTFWEARQPHERFEGGGSYPRFNTRREAVDHLLRIAR